MGLREKINEHRKLSIGIIGGLIVASTSFAIFSNTGVSSSGSADNREPKAWYTTDDGRSWFAESATKLPPFQHEGKEANRIYLYRCEVEGGEPFAGHLERLTPRAKQASTAPPSSDPNLPPDATGLEVAGLSDLQVKRPGDRAWTGGATPAAQKIITVTCPNDASHKLTSVLP